MESASFILAQIGFEAAIHVLGRRKGERFVRYCADRIAREESLASTFPIRPDADGAAAHALAVKVFRRMLPALMAKLSR